MKCHTRAKSPLAASSAHKGQQRGWHYVQQRRLPEVCYAVGSKRQQQAPNMRGCSIDEVRPLLQNVLRHNCCHCCCSSRRCGSSTISGCCNAATAASTAAAAAGGFVVLL